MTKRISENKTTTTKNLQERKKFRATVIWTCNITMHRLVAYNSYTTWATLPLNNWTGEIIKLKPYLSVVDIVWSWWSCFYQEFEDAFEENKFNHLFQSHCALFWPEFTLGFNGGSMYGAETSLFTIGHMNRWGKTKRNNSLWVSLRVKWIKRYNFQGKAKFWQ